MKKTGRIIQVLSSINSTKLLIALCFIIASCHEPEDSPALTYEYSIINSSEIDLGIKIIPISTSNNFKINDTSFKLLTKSEKIFLFSATKQSLSTMLMAIEIYDSNFKTKYRVVDFSQSAIIGNKIIYEITMPHISCKPVVKSNLNIKLYIDDKSIFGFYPRTDQTGADYFITNNDFKDITVKQVSSTSNLFGIVGLFGNTIISQDLNVYAPETKFVISENNGVTWSSYLSVSNGFDDDFLDSYFTSARQGWYFIYNRSESTLVYIVSEFGSVPISKIEGYCVIDSKFLDSDRGYVVANSSNNVSPSDSQNSYLFKTTDGGVSWSLPIEISISEMPEKFFAFPNGKLVLMRGQAYNMHKSFYYSDNDGLTWKESEVPINDFIRDMHFINSEIGYIKTGNDALWSAKNSGFIYKTIDGGKTWSKIPSQSLLGSRVYFFDERNGLLQDVIYGFGQVLLITRDGGLTWKEVMYPYDYLIK